MSTHIRSYGYVVSAASAITAGLLSATHVFCCASVYGGKNWSNYGPSILTATLASVVLAIFGSYYCPRARLIVLLMILFVFLVEVLVPGMLPPRGVR
jgi:ABC-type nickel/cobalt efflux system permease component RcnA